MTRRREWAPPLSLELRPIGVMRSRYVVHHEAPRQPRSRNRPAPGEDCCGEVHVAQGLQNALADLDGFSHVWLLFACHHTRGWNSKLVPPRSEQKRGVFATRAPARPNPIGLSCVRLLRIEKRVLFVGDHDLLDGTPVLDVKPYLPYCDSVPDAAIGWVEQVPADARDHREWWTEKGVEPPRVYRRRTTRPTPDEPQDR